MVWNVIGMLRTVKWGDFGHKTDLFSLTIKYTFLHPQEEDIMIIEIRPSIQ